VIISANGFVFNEYGDVLLIQRDDTRTFAPPGGACGIDELPYLAAAREVKEETGIVALPVRLVALYSFPMQPDPFLFLCFRCIQRGGELAASPESPACGFFKTKPLPSPMLGFHREQIERAYGHAGGQPYWAEHRLTNPLRAGYFILNRVIYPWLHRRRARLGQPAYSPPPQWKVRAMLVLHNDRGESLWLREGKGEMWSLPTSRAVPDKPPWNLIADTAAALGGRLGPPQLTGIYLEQGQPEMTFAFKATIELGSTAQSARSMAYFAPGQEPENRPAGQQVVAADALTSDQRITYRLLV
jgi:ADP-ribose pyrophosphatase YjhB (NUDIX family)